MKTLLCCFIALSSLLAQERWVASPAKLLAAALLPEVRLDDVAPGSLDAELREAVVSAEHGEYRKAEMLLELLIQRSQGEYRLVCQVIRGRIQGERFFGLSAAMTISPGESAASEATLELMRANNASAEFGATSPSAAASNLSGAYFCIDGGRMWPQSLIASTLYPSGTLTKGTVQKPDEACRQVVKEFAAGSGLPAAVWDVINQANQATFATSSATAKRALETAFESASNGGLRGLAYWLALRRGDTEICTTLDPYQNCFLADATQNTSAETRTLAATWYRHAEQSLDDTGRQYEILIRRGRLAILAGDAAGGAVLYEDAARSAAKSAHLRDAALLDAFLGGYAGDNNRFANAMRSAVANGDFGAASDALLRAGKIGSGMRAAGFVANADRMLGAASAAAEAVDWNLTAARLWDTAATEYEAQGRTGAAIEMIERAIRAQGIYLTHLDPVTIPKPSAMFTLLAADPVSEASRKQVALFRSEIRLLEQLSGEEAAPIWLKRLSEVEMRFAAFAEEKPRYARSEFEAEKAAMDRYRVRFDYEWSQLNAAGCSDLAARIKAVRDRAIGPPMAVLAVEMDASRADCDAAFRTRFAATLSHADPVKKMETAWDNFHAGKLAISELFNSGTFLAASLRAARSIGAYDTLITWSRQMKDLASQQTRWTAKTPVASGQFAQAAKQSAELRRQFNQKTARGLDILADVYSSLAGCAQGHCANPDRPVDRPSSVLLDWPAYERIDLLFDATVEMNARLGDGDKALVALNDLLWVREFSQWQTLAPSAAAARLERKAEMGSLTDDERRTLDDLRVANATPASATARAYPSSLPSLLSRLPDNVTILAYYSGPGGLWLCRRRGKGSTKVFPLQTRSEDLTAMAERFRRSLADQTADWETLSADLYRILLPAAGGPIPAGDRVFVVGSGSVGAFPFEALGPSPDRLLAITNPVVYLSTLDSGVKPQWSTAGSALVVGYNGTLARAEEEAEAVAKILQVDPIPPSKATWQDLKTRLTGARIIHFASHASFDPTNPYESSLQLADGPLPVWQLLESSTKPELAVFSACQTRRGLHPGTTSGGLGPDLANMAGLAVAMGTRWTIGSLWKVSDEATLPLMKAFYTRFSPNVSPALAMYQARQQFVSDRKGLALPYTYTGFVVSARDLRSEVLADQPPATAPTNFTGTTAAASGNIDAAFAKALNNLSFNARPPISVPSPVPGAPAVPVRPGKDAVLPLILARHTAALNPGPESDLGLRLRYREIDPGTPVEVTSMDFYRDNRPLFGTFSRMMESPLFDIRTSDVLLRDPQTGKTIRSIPIEKGSTELTPDAKRIVTRSDDDSGVRVRDTETGKVLHEFDGNLGEALEGGFQLLVQPYRIVYFDSKQRVACFVDLDTGREIARVRVNGSSFTPGGWELSPHGRYLVLRSAVKQSHQTIRLWDLSDLQRPRDLGYEIQDVYAHLMRFTADDSAFLITRRFPIGRYTRSEAELIRSATGQPLFNFPKGKDESGSAVDLTPDGQYAIVARLVDNPRGTGRGYQWVVEVLQTKDASEVGMLLRMENEEHIETSISFDGKLLRFGWVSTGPAAGSRVLGDDFWRVSTEALLLTDLIEATKKYDRSLTGEECRAYFGTDICPVGR